MNYKKHFTNFEILEDETNGILQLGLIKRYGQDRDTKIVPNFVGHVAIADSVALQKNMQLLNQKLTDAQPDDIVIGLISSGAVTASALATVRNCKFNYSSNSKF